jgi:hypothetical protein
VVGKTGDENHLHSLSLNAQRFKYRILRTAIKNQIETTDQIWRYRAKIGRRGYWQQYLLRTAIEAYLILLPRKATKNLRG